MAFLHAHPERHPAPGPADPEVEKKQGALVSRLIGPARDGEFEARLKTLALPVLALFGTEDRVIPPEAAHLYAETMPDCRLMMIYDAAHALDADRPEAVASVVADFLVRHERFLVNEESALIHP
jgi:pimeloyl-ACP methyl ester carboxylesterase